MRSATVVLIVMTCRPFTVNNLPGVSGLLGLIVATSKTAGASAAIALGGGGIFHAVSGVARASVSGSDLPPCDQFPAIEFPSALICPSNVLPRAASVMRTVVP